MKFGQYLSANTKYYVKTSAEIWNKETEKYDLVISKKNDFTTKVSNLIHSPVTVPKKEPVNIDFIVSIKPPKITDITLNTVKIVNNITCQSVDLSENIFDIFKNKETLDEVSTLRINNNIVYHLYSDEGGKNLVDRNNTGFFHNLSANTTYYVRTSAEIWNRISKKYDVKISPKVKFQTNKSEKL